MRVSEGERVPERENMSQFISEKPVEEAYGDGGTVGQDTFVGEEEEGAGKPRVLEVKEVIGGGERGGRGTGIWFFGF
eukprot:CAMPEP_0182516796 /NCGR_PEP_ID=MMETSP1321-20130603/41049_1 /TAXON_ID=91990 /ORGANISM="Bolidomonas sp., Strain RCC1657" /LENGTH=76 /DNA_ID=CAMNT_0024724445 /DNA_START=469 /DNA_END=699 /DNA_ORIENTATION=-